jgi:arsenate reductase (thioredoxin)
MKNLKWLLIGAIALFSFQIKTTSTFDLNNEAVAMENRLFAEIEDYISDFQSDTSSIPPERRQALREITRYAEEGLGKNQDVKLTFICTHNSRRSHLAQIWTAVAANYYGLGESISSFSGGTETTAFNPRAVAALQRAGLQLNSQDHSTNPRYSVRFSEDGSPLECFSKKYSDESNPQSGFAAIMTCSHADESCPIVRGAEDRIAIPYVDPKVSDGSPEEVATYDARCRQIAQEMFYWVSKIQRK